MIHAWDTSHAVTEAIADVKIGIKMGVNINQWCRYLFMETN